jgi:predicted MFS family arabinose efflux permease
VRNRPLAPVATLALRFSYVLALSAAPLLRGTHPLLFMLMGTIGLMGVAVILTCLLAPRAREVLQSLQPLALLLLAFTQAAVVLLAGSIHPALAALLPLSLGYSMALNELTNLEQAVVPRDRRLIRVGLASFNTLKTIGLAFGFVIGCLLTQRGPSRWLVVAAVLTGSLALSVAALNGDSKVHRLPKRTQDSSESEASTGIDLRSPVHIRPATGLILLDAAASAFWFAFLPVTVILKQGVSPGIVATALAIHAITHSIGQQPWRRVAAYIGDSSAFWTSWIAQAVFVGIICTVRMPMWPMLGAFAGLGLLNSGTYTTATTCLYVGVAQARMASVIGQHQLVNQLGRALGAQGAVIAIATTGSFR